MTRARSKNWLDHKRVSFTVSYTHDPEVLAFLFSDEAEAARLFKQLLRDHIIRTAHPCSDPVVCASIRQAGLLQAMLADRAKILKSPEQRVSTSPASGGAPGRTSAESLPPGPTLSGATAARHPAQPDAYSTDARNTSSGKNRKTIKTFLS